APGATHIPERSRQASVPPSPASGELQVGFRLCVPGEGEDKSLLVLRHGGEHPAAAAALVQQIRECILVVARTLREPVHHRLVFFHGRWNSRLPPMSVNPELESGAANQPPAQSADAELERAREFPSLVLIRHPLVRHKATLLR